MKYVQYFSIKPTIYTVFSILFFCFSILHAPLSRKKGWVHAFTAILLESKGRTRKIINKTTI